MAYGLLARHRLSGSGRSDGDEIVISNRANVRLAEYNQCLCSTRRRDKLDQKLSGAGAFNNGSEVALTESVIRHVVRQYNDIQ